jgi:hypothetical protein
MRTFLLFLGIAGLAVLVNGQTSTAQGLVKSITAPGQRMTADSIERTGSTIWRLRGSVRIVQDTAIITADEVDAQILSNGNIEYDLHGNVHLTMNRRK